MTTAVMVLCAGFGTRLRPFTDELPKPLVPVGDRPALAHILEVLGDSGFRRVVANVHHRADQLAAWARSPTGAAGSGFSGELVLVQEATILGTAGGVAGAASALGPGAVLIWNGDIVSPELCPQAVVEAFAAGGDAALWVVAPRPVGQGTVGVDRSGRLVRVRGKTFGVEHAGGDFLGIQVLSDEVRARLPEVGCLVGDVALPLLERGGRIATFSFEREWHDIGDSAGLWAANLAWLRRRALRAWIAPDVEVPPSVELDTTLVGQGATVSGAGEVKRCMVLPGAHLTAPVSDTIVGRQAAMRIAGRPK